jgi:recombinational DNA repair ATPase RecF
MRERRKSNKWTIVLDDILAKLDPKTRARVQSAHRCKS